MPIDKHYGGKGDKVMKAMSKHYGAKHGKEVFYALENKMKKKMKNGKDLVKGYMK